MPANSHDDIIKYCEQKLEWWWVKYMFKVKKIVIDNADSILVSTWRSRNRFNTIQVKGCVKAYQKIITLVTRCELKQQLLLQNRLLWSSRALNSYNAHTRLLLDEDGSVLDMSVQDNDMNDTTDYALTEKWNDITRNIQRE